MTVGDRVLVAAAGVGSVVARVDAVVRVAELPAIAGAPDVDQVRGILAEGQCERIVLLSYEYSGDERAVIAFDRGAAGWWTLRGQRLQLALVMGAG